MRKRPGLLIFFMTLLLTLVTGQIISPWTSLLAATTTDPERQVRDLPVIKRNIMEATRYGDANVEIVIKDNQFVVTITNSKLNRAPSQQREAEAEKIVSAITDEISSRPEFGIIPGAHINYISQTSGSNHIDMIDGIDFRKDASGNYVHHKT